MRMAHPGCRGPAGGKGYNSGGNYCGGWAGNCGDGGMGGSSWYLMCEKCRDNYIKKIAPPPVAAAAPAVPPPPPQQQQPNANYPLSVDQHQNGGNAYVVGAPFRNAPVRVSNRHHDQQQLLQQQLQRLQQAEMKQRKKSVPVRVSHNSDLFCKYFPQNLP